MRLTLKSKVLLLAMVPVLLFALVLSGGAVLILKKQADAEVKDTRERLLGDRRAELEHYVQIAMGSIQAEYDRSANGDLNARAEAIARLSKIKYGKDGYIFGYDSQVVRLFRGDSPVDVGKSFRDRRDPSGVYLNRELVEAGRNGQPLRDLYLAAAGQRERHGAQAVLHPVPAEVGHGYRLGDQPRRRRGPVGGNQAGHRRAYRHPDRQYRGDRRRPSGGPAGDRPGGGQRDAAAVAPDPPEPR